jgi:predicted permease
MTWWHRLWRGRQMEDQLDRELRFHLEQHAADLIARGIAPAEARRQARVAIGGPEQVKEDCRDARGTRWVEDLLQDVRYALRTLRQKPGFSAVALLTLALGIGATTVMFTVIDGVLLKPLPYPAPDRLLAVHGYSDTWNVAAFGQQNLAYLDFLDCRREVRSAAIAGWLFSGGTVSAPGDPEYVDLREISPDLFSVVGIPLVSGRTFLPEEDRPGTGPVAILGYSFWQRRFAGNPDALGASLVLDGKRYTVVGIASAKLQLAGEPDIYTPVGQDTARFLQNRRAHPITVLARLAPGATQARASAELAAMARRLAGEHPDTNAGRSFVAAPLRPEVGDARSTLWLLFGAVGLVLLISCVNIASLLLARAVSRERELALRVALGAARSRLARQCLTESAVLSLVGGALGVVLAAIAIRPFIAFWPGSLPRADEVRLNWQVLLTALAISAGSGLLFGLAPTLRVAARELEQSLRAGGRNIGGNSRRLHGGFVIAEIALAVVLLVAAGILGRTLVRLSSLDPGVNTQNVLVTRMALSPAVLASPVKIRTAWQEVLERGRTVPGVQAIATVDTVPMRQGNNQLGYWPSADVPPANQQRLALATSVTPEYLQVMGIALRAGRFFDDRDRIDSEPVVAIDDVMARHAFGEQNPIGRRIWIPDMGAGPFKVVGVVAHVRHWGLAGDDQARVRDQFYYPFAQVADPLVRRWSDLMSIAVRTNVPPLTVLPALRRELRGAGADQVLYQVRTMEQLADGSLARQRFLLLLFAVFAGLALLLAATGIYGVLAYVTNQRVPEIGVRMALGASGGAVMRLVFGQSLRLIAVGAAIGTAGAFAAGRVLERLVEGVRSTEPLTFAAMIGILVATALLASWIPARRASRVDPLSALRQQ